MPDIIPVIAHLTTRVREPNVDDWKKLLRMIRYIDKKMPKIASIGLKMPHLQCILIRQVIQDIV